MSRPLYPKQFLPLVTSATLPRETAARPRDGRYARPMFIRNEEHRFVVAEQSRQAGITPAEIVLDAGELHIVEIQSGATLNENGIERFEDVYGRI